MIGSTALIIDDKFTDGLAVAKTLWSKGYSCFFYDYSTAALANTQKQSGIRIIFQDICLVGSSTPSKTDYDAATTTIEGLLESDNGPWLLATWSTWEGDGNHAQQLFDHLRENLSTPKMPFDFVLLDKAAFTEGGPGNHSQVKEFGPTECDALIATCTAKLAEFPSFKGITNWEKALAQSAHKTVHDIAAIPMELTPQNFDHSLGDMLYRIGVAETGKKFSYEEQAIGVSRVLNNLASNKSYFSAVLQKEALRDSTPKTDISSEMKRNWARRTNHVLHLEKLDQISPGAVYIFKKPKHYYSENGNLIAELEKFYSEKVLKENLLIDFKTHSAYEKIYEKSKLILIDVTPPCDHAQKKSQWRKFIVGSEVIVHAEELSSKVKENKFSKLFKLASKWKGPCFCTGVDITNKTVRFFYVDMRLVMSVPDDDQFLTRLEPLYLIKEQLLRDLISSLSAHLSRPGIVDLAR